MNHSDHAIQATFDRLIRLARSYGLNPRWQLVRGVDRVGSTPRTPWRVEQDGLVLFTLGYTRRGAHEALSLLATVFEYLVSTDDWTEE